MREGRGSALDYFSLPVSESNLLDGSMISRDAADENLFHLKLPVSDNLDFDGVHSQTAEREHGKHAGGWNSRT